MTAKIVCYIVGAAVAGGAITHHAPKVIKPRDKVSAVKQSAPTAPPATARIMDCPVTGLGQDGFSGGIGGGNIGGNPHGGGNPPWYGGGGVPSPPSIIPPNVIPSVPEPDSWAMLISGFGLIGISARRKRNKIKVVLK